MVEKDSNKGKIIRRPKSKSLSEASCEARPFYKKQVDFHLMQVSQESLQKLADYFNSSRH